MRAILQRGRIRVIPVPTQKGGQLVVWLKKPITEGNKPFVQADIEANKKFYDLPCPLENVNDVKILYPQASLDKGNGRGVL